MKWYYANRERHRENGRRWRERNRERHRELNRQTPPEKRREYAARYKERHPDRVAESRKKQNRRSVVREFGLTVADYEAKLAAQNAVCMICAGTNPSGRALSIDHDHATGVIRDLLCQRCNSGLGQFLEDPGLLLKAVGYLLRHRGQI